MPAPGPGSGLGAAAWRLHPSPAWLPQAHAAAAETAVGEDQLGDVLLHPTSEQHSRGAAPRGRTWGAGGSRLLRGGAAQAFPPLALPMLALSRAGLRALLLHLPGLCLVPPGAGEGSKHQLGLARPWGRGKRSPRVCRVCCMLGGAACPVRLTPLKGSRTRPQSGSAPPGPHPLTCPRAASRGSAPLSPAAASSSSSS